MAYRLRSVCALWSTRGNQDVCALDDVRLWQLDSLMDQMPTEFLPPGIPLWINTPVEVRRRIVLKHLPEVRIVVESMQRELQLARQRPAKRRLASPTCPCDKDMLLSTDHHRVFCLLSSCLSRTRPVTVLVSQREHSTGRKIVP